MPDEKEKKQPIGALWEKTTRNGDCFLSGNIEVNGEKIKITCFQNGYKKEDKHPDLKIYLDTYERPEGGGQSKSYASHQPDPQPATRNERPQDVQPPHNEDDIPF